MKDVILAISGKPGLYRLVAQGQGNLIVETLDETRRRLTAGARDRVTSLGDVSMYTMDEDMPLMQVFENMKQKEEGKEVAFNPKKVSEKELYDYLAEVLPNCDADRIYPADIKKLVSWYNILVKAGITDFVEEETTEAAEAAE